MVEKKQEDKKQEDKKQANIEKFKKQAIKAVKETLAITLLPPKPDKKDELGIVVLIDDRDVKFHDKLKFREDYFKKLDEIAKKIDKNILPDALLLEELWQNMYDGKHDLLGLLAQSTAIYDTGMLAALTIAEIHKSMVIKKFEKYVVSYVFAGSLVQGKATPESDIDVFVIVDDTDVKKMTRYELREKLRAIILGMATEAGMITGIKNKLNVQIWILTDFWDGLKEANPVYFTNLRDGVPLYDRGMFMPWKLLLKMGRIKPSPESIEMYMSSGDQVLKRVHLKLNEIGVEDMFWATLNPSQAALMLYGLPPPTPKETPTLLRDIFVKKEKILEESYVKILESIIKTRKDLEHNPEKNITGKEVDELLGGAEKYLKRINKMFEEMEKEKRKEDMLTLYDRASEVVRSTLKLEGVEKVAKADLVKSFENYVVNMGKLPEKSLRLLKSIEKGKQDYEKGKLTKAEVDKVKKDSEIFLRMVIEYVQAKRAVEIERAKIRIKHGKKMAEITLLDDTAYIIEDIDATQKQLQSAKIKPNGGLMPATKASLADYEKHLASAIIPEKVFIKQAIFDDLKKHFGPECEVLITF